MKLGLKLLGLLGIAIAIWWFSVSTTEPQAQSSDQSATVTKTVVEKNTNEMATTFTDFDSTGFEAPAEASQWRTVNDNVMGGISQSSFVITSEGTGLFRGNISLENNGGFTSVRRAVGDFDFSEMAAIALRVKGDGRRYQFRINTDSPDDPGISYRAEFDTTDGEWLTVRLPLSEFEPVFRGRILDNVEALDPTKIRQIGFLLADEQSGEFSLEIDWIQVE